jgi:endonuclease YncB( thermonuclease family)
VKPRPAAVLALFASLLSASLSALTLRGIVQRVSDGDTIVVKEASGRTFKVRLSAIDAPEKGQAFGKRAQQNLYQMVARKDVVVTVNDTDRWGRLTGKVECGLVDAGLAQIKAGLAWVVLEYLNRLDRRDAAAYVDAERTAKATSRGLWSDPNRIPPWQFRRRNNSASPRPRRQLQPQRQPVPAVEGCAVIGNRRSKVFHRPDCPAYSKVSPGNRVCFASADEAAKAGYRLAGNCP